MAVHYAGWEQTAESMCSRLALRCCRSEPGVGEIFGSIYFSDSQHWTTTPQRQPRTHSELYNPELQNRTRITREIKVWYMRYNIPIQQTPINRELGPSCNTYSGVKIFEWFDYERNSSYVFINTPPTSNLAILGTYTVQRSIMKGYRLRA